MATLIDVEMLDGSTKRIKVITADRVAVGNAGKGSTDDVQRNPVDYQARLVYECLRRNGEINGQSYPDWLATVSDLDMVDSSVNPTERENGDTP